MVSYTDMKAFTDAKQEIHIQFTNALMFYLCRPNATDFNCQMFCLQKRKSDSKRQL